MVKAISLNGSDWKLLPSIPREWEWRRVWDIGTDLTPALWIPAAVPGVVQEDAMDAGLIPDYTVGFNSRACEWTSQRDWAYLKEFECPEVPEGHMARLVFAGVDYECHVYLNGEHLGDHVGMYDVFEFDVTDKLRTDGPNRLVVVCEHAPDIQGQIDRTSEVRRWKARFAYNWDWCTRLVPIGIYNPVHLVITGTTRVADMHIVTDIADDYTSADVGINVDLRAEAGEKVSLRATITREGEEVAAGEAELIAAGERTGHTFTLRVDDPALWWPNGHGEQALYEAVVDVVDADGNTVDHWPMTFGIRRLRAVANGDSPEGALPYVVEINGKRIFIKGWNWAPLQQLYGRISSDQYERWLRIAANANCNLLRVWGGGLLEKKAFYDWCDRLGIMVWQEFIQSSSGINNRPATDDEYVDYIRGQAEKMVPQRRNHPSLVIWTGGNELMDDAGTPLDENHPALAALKDVVDRLDPGKIWFPASGSGPYHFAAVNLVGQMHDVHGPWQYQGPIDQYLFYNGIDPLLHSEYGVEGAANPAAIKRVAADDPAWPPDETNPLWLHHGAWWVQRPMMARVFGEIDDLDTYVRASQLLQAEGLRYANEAHRRRKWHCAGTMPWQYNESWPNLSCTNSMDYYGQPRPVYWWLKHAWEPLHVSAKYDKIVFEPGETLYGEVWLSNSVEARPGVTVSWDITDLNANVLASGEATVDAPENAGLHVCDIKWEVPEVAGGIAILRVRGGESTNWYVFGVAEEPAYQPLLSAPATDLAVTRSDGEISISNAGSAWALFVRLEAADEESWIYFSDNYLLIAPGETVTIGVEPADACVEVSGWNFEARTV